MRGPADRSGSLSHRIRPDSFSANRVAASIAARSVYSANGGVARVGEVEAATVADNAHLHAVHHVAEREPRVGIGPRRGAAGAEVTERARARKRDQLRRNHEAETELHVEVEQHSVRPG